MPSRAVASARSSERVASRKSALRPQRELGLHENPSCAREAIGGWEPAYAAQQALVDVDLRSDEIGLGEPASTIGGSVRTFLQLLDRVEIARFAPLWLDRNPSLRALAELAATPRAWVDLFFRCFAIQHPFASIAWRAELDRLHVESSLSPSVGSCYAWGSFVHEVVQYVPTLLGARRLEPIRVCADATGAMRATYVFPSMGSPHARVRRLTPLTFGTIFEAIARVASSLPPESTAERLGSREPEGSDPMGVFCERHGLSPRERSVLALLDEGCRPEEIGAKLGLRTSTVRSHLKRLYSKTRTGGQQALLRRLSGCRLT
jgi:DNA-binding CsgD family transcriptional regulator